MNMNDLITIAQLEQQLTRYHAMCESCIKFDAPQEALDALTSRIVETNNQIAAIKSTGFHYSEYWETRIAETNHLRNLANS